MAFSGVKLDGKHLLNSELEQLSAQERERAYGQLRSRIDDAFGRPERAVIFAAPGLIAKFTTAAYDLFVDGSGIMQTAVFKQDVVIPYIETRYNEIHSSMPRHPRGPVHRNVGHNRWGGWEQYVETFDVPEEVRKTLETTRLSWHEARKAKDKNGAYYEIHEIEKTPALSELKTDSKTESRILGNSDGVSARLDKLTAIKFLQALEYVALEFGKTPLRDAKPFHHFSRYSADAPKTTVRNVPKPH